jgi:hypothetical protein
MSASGSSDVSGAMEVTDDGRGRGGGRRCSDGEVKHGRCTRNSDNGGAQIQWLGMGVQER